MDIILLLDQHTEDVYSSSVTETAQTFDNTYQGPYEIGTSRLNSTSDDYIWKVNSPVGTTSGWDYYVDDYDSEVSYAVGDVFYYSGQISQMDKNLNIVSVTDLADWDAWSIYSVKEYLKPFDKQKYTKAYSASPLEYRLKGVKYEGHNDRPTYDCVVFGNVIADSISVEFQTGTGSHIETQTVYVDTDRDPNQRLKAAGTTVIVRKSSDQISFGMVNISINSAGLSPSVGTIAFGLSTRQGFTNLNFTNKYVDYSPYEQDQWGNINYIPGNKISTLICTVDIPIDQLDMTRRLMTGLGGETIAIDGSNSANSEQGGAPSVFAATRIIGRVKDFSLFTNIKGKRLSDVATYAITIEENV